MLMKNGVKRKGNDWPVFILNSKANILTIFPHQK